MEIKITGFYITAYGDRTVGLFDQTWQLDGIFYFEDKEELEEMRKKIKETFESYTDDISVQTFEELELLIQKQNEFFSHE